MKVGIDIVETSRIKATIERFGERFLTRVFTVSEREFCDSRADPYQSYGARFAAKEAILKALGTGKSEGIRWQDMEIIDDEHSRPEVRLYGKVQELVAGKLHISLSHTAQLAVAICVLEE